MGSRAEGGLRHLYSVAGGLAGFLIVIAFAGAIHVTNLLFSHALYSRDAAQTAKRITWELRDALTGEAAQSSPTAPVAETATGLRPSLDGPAPAGPRTAASAETALVERLDALLRHLQTHEDVRPLAILVFPATAATAEPRILARASSEMIEAMAGDLAPLIDQVRVATEAIVAPPPVFSRETEQRTLIAVPVRIADTLRAAVVLSYDQHRTGAFLTDLVRLGVAIMGSILFVATGLAALLVWLRVRDRLKVSKTIQFLAHHDALTGLPNRTVFNTKLTEALRLAHAKASSISVILIDLDKFKDVNDTHGHAAGDLFLQVVADRMSSVFSRHLVARLSGDEFAVLLVDEADRESATRLAEAMVAATRLPTRIDGKDIPVSVSMGIAQASDAAWRASRLLHCADLALYRAKHGGRSTFVWYTADMDAEARERRQLEGDLRQALRHDQFRLLYQPQLTLSNLTLTGYEALLRWEHPERGTISPSIFIPIAEEAGLIEEIGAWVLRRACLEAAAWDDAALTVSVNVSPAQFRAGLTERRVAEALRASGLDPRRLEIEITESLLIANTDAVVKTLTAIRALGVSIAMDDFGTGYSSLSYLSRFPFDTIKIDRSFVATLGHNATTDAIIASIVGLGRSLGVTITAEGVETEGQVLLLRAAGCDKLQGFLFGRPLDLSDARAAADASMQRERSRNALYSAQRSTVASALAADEVVETARPIFLPDEWPAADAPAGTGEDAEATTRRAVPDIDADADPAGATPDREPAAAPSPSRDIAV